jgi:hypothetical protein
MTFEDYEDPINSESLSDFDKIRLTDLEVGDKLESETGNWTVYRYIDEYLFLSNKRKNNKFNKFKSSQELIHFLMS